MATNEREDIIRRAVLDKLGNSLNFFTADEILTVAGITPENIKEMKKDLEAARRRAIPSWLYLSIYNQIKDDLTETRERMRELADTMADCSDYPETAKFKNAVLGYQARRQHAEKQERIIAGLEDIEPPAVAAGVAEAGE